MIVLSSSNLVQFDPRNSEKGLCESPSSENGREMWNRLELIRSLRDCAEIG